MRPHGSTCEVMPKSHAEYLPARPPRSPLLLIAVRDIKSRMIESFLHNVESIIVLGYQIPTCNFRAHLMAMKYETDTSSMARQVL